MAALKDKAVWQLNIRSLASFSDDLGLLGAKVGPRTGPTKRTQDQMDEYCIRRFLIALKHAGRLICPAMLTRPEHGQGPDFILFQEGQESLGIEVTEATSQEWQKALTEDAHYVGEDVAVDDVPYDPDGFVAEIEAALSRKLSKAARYREATSRCDLLVYDNSGHISGFPAEWKYIQRVTPPAGLRDGFNRVHLLCGNALFFDIFGNAPSRIDISADYDVDLVHWAEVQSSKLRAANFDELDIHNLAEELESLGRSDLRALTSQLQRLMLHLLKTEAQPERDGTSWRLSIDNARDEIADLLRESPSLKVKATDLLDTLYTRARRDAASETGLPLAAFPAVCPYTWEELLDETFYPAARQAK